jgi:hypothetical protein
MMKKVLVSVCLVMFSVASWAQSSPSDIKKNGSHASHIKTKNKASQMATGSSAVGNVLTPVELAIAKQVYTGKLPCELGASVNLKADVKTLGYFDVQLGHQTFRMLPVETTTGAIRLEDKTSGAVWLQLANKSMLMNHKLGQRLADECMSPEQSAMAMHLIKNPAPSVLDSPLKVAAK